jgi:hypothetical protein
VSGHLELDSIEARGEVVGSLKGDITFLPSRFSIENASLVAPDQSRADFTVGGSTTGRDDISLHANVEGLDLETFVRLAAPDLTSLVSGGKVTGRIDLAGLPGPRGIQGTADVAIGDVQFQVASPEDGRETETLSVPNLTTEVRIADNVVNIENLESQLGGSTISGQCRKYSPA